MQDVTQPLNNSRKISLRTNSNKEIGILPRGNTIWKKEDCNTLNERTKDGKKHNINFPNRNRDSTQKHMHRCLVSRKLTILMGIILK